MNATGGRVCLAGPIGALTATSGHRSRRRPRLLAAVAILAPVAIVDAAPPPLDTASITAFVRDQMRWSRLPGVAVTVVGPGQALFVTAFGPDGSRLTPDSPFVLGSVTKTFTALAIAQLADAGKLGFDDPVTRHLPNFALKRADAGRDITLRHLLTHTSGLRQWSGHDRRAQREGRFDHIAPVRPPGLAFEYSSLNYMILGQVVVAASGMSYAAYVQSNIFEPLEMRASFTDLESARLNGLVQGHSYLFGLPLARREVRQPDALVPAGFLVSSARDLGHYLSMLLSDGTFRGRQVVSPDALGQMFTPWGGGASGAGMAWGIGASRIGHAGNTPTSSARLSILRAERYGVAVLASVNSGPFFPGTEAVMDGVVRIVRGETADTVRPDEILLKLGILALMLAGIGQTLFALRRWAARGFPRRLTASRPVVKALALEAAAAALVLLVIPRWIGVPLLTILEYFPDLGIAMLVGVASGALGALFRSFVLASGSAPTITGSAA